MGEASKRSLRGTKVPHLGSLSLRPVPASEALCKLSRSCRRSQVPEPRCSLDRYNQKRRAPAPNVAEPER